MHRETDPRHIGDLLNRRAASAPDREFLLLEDGTRRFTFHQFAAAVDHAAALLSGLGATKGRAVSLFLTNRAEYLIFYFACFRLGAWAGPVNALLKAEEVAFVLDNSEATIAVTQPDLLPILQDAAARVPNLQSIIVVGEESARSGIIPYTIPPDEALREAPSFDIEINEDDEAVIIYTSGTTGRPKGVLLTHGNILSNARQIAEWLRLTEEDRALMIMPLFHVNALMTTCMAALWSGASTVLAPRFSASRHWRTVSDFGVTYFGSVATMLSLLNTTYPNGLPEGVSIERLRFALCGSAPVPVEVMKQFEALFGCPVIEGYGLSESTCRSTFNPLEGRRPGSVGLPIGNEMKIFDDKDRELGPNEIGEIVLRGPNIMKGYYRNPEATREAFRSGWFHTGDLGYRDQDGFFYVVDRKNDMIIRGGENIYPREIDEVLYRHPAVKDAATVGVPDALYGEEVKSFVVLRDGAAATAEELIGFCRQHLADYKCPKSVEILEEIPKGPTGKLLKRELAARSLGDPEQKRDPDGDRQ